MIDPVTLIAGAVISLVSMGIGYLTGRRRRKAVNPPTVCDGCRHGLSYHDDHGACHRTDRRRRYDDRGFDCGPQDFRCTCQQYVGPVPADRMLASFQPSGLEVEPNGDQQS